jgi:hypothetical protein
MNITKDGCEIHSIADWFNFAPPRGGLRHWVDGRSAKELARAWFPPAGGLSVPEEFLALVNSSERLVEAKVDEPFGEIIHEGEELPK